jgi:hypothetical protein
MYTECTYRHRRPVCWACLYPVNPAQLAVAQPKILSYHRDRILLPPTYSPPFPKNVNAATTNASVPVLNVGCIHGAKNGE